MVVVGVSNSAYAKLMLHLVQHPHTPVCGYLIGNVSESEVIVDDIVPLFHTHVLTPMLEIATNLIEKNAKNIVGYYHVNERINDRGIPIVAERIASAVERNCPGAVLLQVLNDKLADPNEHALQVWGVTKNGTWNQALEIDQSSPFSNGLELASKGVEARLHEEFHDFDDHFEDISKDPFNVEIDKDLASL